MSVYYDDTSSTISYSSGWAADLGAGYGNGTYHQNTSPVGGVYADITFSGSQISVLGSSWHDHGRLYCHFVDMPSTQWAWYNSSFAATAVTNNLTLCSATGVPNSAHTLRIGNAAEDNKYLNIDFYTLDTTAAAGNTPVWSSSFPTVGAAPSLAGQSFSATAESSSSSTQSSSSTSSSSSSSASATASKGSSSIGVGGGVGIGIGVAAAAAFAAFVYWYRKRGRKEEDQGREKYGGTSYTTSPPPPSGTFTRPSPQLAGQFNRSEGGMTIPYSPITPEVQSEDYGIPTGQHGGQYDSYSSGGDSYPMYPTHSEVALVNPSAFAPR